MTNKRMLKIAHLADTHIGMENYGRINPETGLNQRLHDFLNSLDQAIDGAIEAGVDLVVFAGDQPIDDRPELRRPEPFLLQRHVIAIEDHGDNRSIGARAANAAAV